MATKTARKRTTRKATGTKRSAAKETTRKASAKKTEAKAPGKRDQVQAAALEMAPKVKALKDEGKSWAEIGKALSIQPTKAIVLFDIAKVRPKDRIKELDADIVVELRDSEELSWSEIAGRATAGGTYTTIAKVKALYAESGKQPSGRKGSGRKVSAKSAKATKSGAKAKAKRSTRRKSSRPSS